jgi:hypothetical protein
MQVDTISKRLMSNRANVCTIQPLHQTVIQRSDRPIIQLSFQTLNAVVFRNAAEASVGGKFLSLFPGLGYAAGYKILQRIYKCVLGSVVNHTRMTS